MTTAAMRISRITILLISFALLLIAAYPALAEDATSSTTNRDASRDARKATIQDRVETRKNIAQQRIDTGITAMREKIASKEAALKLRLETFKDKRKSQIAERVNTNLNKINQNQTSQMLKHLDRMSAILDKLEARVNRPTPDIKDPAKALAAIADARSAIASASAAVSAQAEKDYTIEVSTEAKIRQDAQSQREQLHTDLKAVRTQVIDAKQAVANAIRVAKSGSSIKEGTRSGQQ